MRIVVAAARDSSGHYRLRQPIAELERQGANLDVHLADGGLPLETNLRTGRFEGLDLDADLLILQRPMWHQMPDAIRHVQAKGTKVIVEIDDDFHTADSHNRAFTLNHPKRSPLANWQILGDCVRHADLVTVSTPQLARRYGSHGRVVVLRNMIDDHWLDIPRRGDGRTVGWAGTVTNHPHDCQATRGGLAQALDDHPDWRFRCVGGEQRADEVLRAFGLQWKRDVAFTPWTDLSLHPYLVAHLDVGLVPLADTTFNHAKSWLKGLEYAALGIPFVASDLPEYRLLNETAGVGVLVANKAKHWRRAVNRLINDPNTAFITAVGRQYVREHLTISRNAWRWAEAWHELARPRQRFSIAR